jgi:sterol desaturase/sphingolipid hydroxylase (fatty acid hydroxylase superfamily)
MTTPAILTIGIATTGDDFAAAEAMPSFLVSPCGLVRGSFFVSRREEDVSFRINQETRSVDRRTKMYPHQVLGPRLFGFRVLPILFVSILVEIVWYLFLTRRSYPWRDLFVSLGAHVLRVPSRLIAPVVIAPVAFFLWTHRLTTIPLNTAWGLALLFLSVEFAYYWMHRCSHQIRWLWASHVVHHSPEHIHLASAIRLGATEVLSGNWLFYLPLYWLGFNPLAVGAAIAFNLFYQFWLHTDLIGRLGPLEWIFNTPSHHRVHHASNSDYLDRNYGGVLIVWDRLFATFAQERPDTPISYGLVHPIMSSNPLTIALHEWVAMACDVLHAASWRGRLRQLFGRPGDSLTSVALRAHHDGDGGSAVEPRLAMTMSVGVPVAGAK